MGSRTGLPWFVAVTLIFSACQSTEDNSTKGRLPIGTDPPPGPPVVGDPGTGGGNIAPATAIGATDGEFKVGQGGDASYSIALNLVKGTSGVQPTFSLVYNSSGGDSPLGVGWNLGGQSVITRCAATIAQDGFVDGVDFDANDRFCLDGQRLVAISGAYGADGTEYRTEVDTIARIYSRGAAPGGGPEKFEVYNKSGQILQYGYTDDSRVEAMLAAPGSGPLPVSAWAVNRAADRVGNYMTFSYFEGPGDDGTGRSGTQHYLTRVDYTGNAASNADGGITPYASVVLEYEPRPDPLAGYESGTIAVWRVRLKRIVNSVGDVPMRTYSLGYAQSPAGRSLLSSVQECGSDGTCFPATTFGNTMTNPGFGAASAVLSGLDPASARYYRSFLGRHETFGDLDGDGDLDRAWIPQNETTIVAMLWNGSSFAPATPWLAGPAAGSGGVPVFSLGGSHEAWLDMNGDGKTDRVWIPEGLSDLYVAISTGTAFGTPQIWLRDQAAAGVRSSSQDGLHEGFGDVDGNGLPDFLWVPEGGTEGQTPVYAALNNGTGFAAPKIVFRTRPFALTSLDGRFEDFIDLNGDGLVDYAWIPKGDVVTYVTLAQADGSLPNGDLYGNPTVWSAEDSIPPKDSGGKDHFRTFEDVTGDRLSDLVFYKANGACGEIRVAVNTGRSFLPSRVFASSCGEAGSVPPGSRDVSYQQFVDLNDDGRKDHVWIPSDRGATWVAYSTGTSFGTPQAMLPASPNNVLDILGVSYFDVDNDGAVDRVFIPANSTGAVMNKGNRIAHRLETITNGFGRRVQITYDTLANPAVYTQDHNAIFPVLDAAGAMVVVARTDISDGKGGLRTRSYGYQGLKMHLQGLGNLGMRRTLENDQARTATTVRDFSQDYSRRRQGMVVGGATVHLRADRRPTDPLVDQLVGTTEYTNQYETTIQLGRVYRNRLTRTETYERGLYNEVLSRRTTENLEVDAYDNVIRLRTAVYDAQGNVVGESSVHNTYTNDAAIWSLGLLTRAETTRKLPVANPQGSLLRVSTQRWNVPRRLLEEEVVEPDAPEYRVTSSYEYDGFGNRTQSSFAGLGVTTRVASAVFDPATGRVPVEATNPLMQVTKAEYDPRALITAVEDPNELRATFEYDGFGRRVLETKSDGTKTKGTFGGCASGCPPFASYSLTIEVDGQPTTTQYFDLLGRLIRAQTVNPQGRTVIEEEAFDTLGRAVSLSEPYFSGERAYATQVQYDPLDRPIRVTNPDNSFTTMSYRGQETVMTNELMQSRTETRDVLGTLTSVRDAKNYVVHYRYDEGGNLVEVRDPNDNLTTITFDRLGRKTALSDPDKGASTFTYNPFGQLTTQTDAKGQVTTFDYDALGRAAFRLDHDGGATSYTYDSATNGIGALARVAQTTCRGLERAACLMRLAATTDYSEAFAYDSLGRPERVTTTIAGETFVASTTYDSLGRADVMSYPAGAGAPLRIRNVYDRGYLSEVKNAGTDASYWKMDRSDARGNVTRWTLGNGLSSTRSYDAPMGKLNGIQTGGGGQSVQSLSYDFDPIGNLRSRRDELQDIGEIAKYDELNRLKSVETQLPGGTQTTTTDYDAIGNITMRSELGEYGYAGTCDGIQGGPHAVATVGQHGAPNPKAYCYDANGSMIRSGDRQVEYSAYDKPVRFVQGSTETLFAYGPNRQRYQRVDATAAGSTTTTYVGGSFERSVTAAKTAYRYFIGDFAIYTESVTAGSEPTTVVQYVHRDHLGSVETITDAEGKVVQHFNYDAWGKRRNPDFTNADDPTAFSSDVTLRGFTGQEEIDGFSLVHMNGRVYDPVIGRFLSADPYVQSPDNLQSYNRYSYVNNNPLSATDPSGYFSLKKFAKRLFDRTLGKKSLYGAVIRGARSGLRGVARVWAKVPGLEAVAGAVACLAGGPAGCIAFAEFSTAVQLSAGASLGDVLLGSAVGFVTGFGLDVGANFVNGLQAVQGFSSVTRGFLNFGLDQLSGGISGGLAAEALGMKFKDGFKSGAFAGAIQATLLPRNAFDALGAGSAVQQYEKAARNYQTALARATAIDFEVFVNQLKLQAARNGLEDLEPVQERVGEAALELSGPREILVTGAKGIAVDEILLRFPAAEPYGGPIATIAEGAGVFIATMTARENALLQIRELNLTVAIDKLTQSISSLRRQQRAILNEGRQGLDRAFKALEAEEGRSAGFEN